MCGRRERALEKGQVGARGLDYSLSGMLPTLSSAEKDRVLGLFCVTVKIHLERCCGDIIIVSSGDSRLEGIDRCDYICGANCKKHWEIVYLTRYIEAEFGFRIPLFIIRIESLFVEY